ncbi:MAG TPA: FAD/NAD(P)-binding protein [Candidatus Dormibacteraeota bacterium]|nr:FAD/NAD(P)-binding protein [Candidatus Dormibacteraeota bacterium]
MLPVSYRVAGKRRETHDTWTLALEPEGEELLEHFAPGQFAMLYSFGTGEVPISISADLTAPGPLVHTIRAVGAVTESLCSLDEGAYVGARGPFGTSWPIEQVEGRDIIVMAGGIGLAPLRPVIYQVLARRERYGRLCVMYGGRSPGELLYLDELEQWRGRFDVDLDVAVDSAGPEWRGRVGVVTTLVSRAEFDPANTTAFLCGPEVMMRFGAMALRDAGLPDTSIQVSMERSMKCAVGHCGHCQLREMFICKDGPVFPLDVIEPLMKVRAL